MSVLSGKILLNFSPLYAVALFREKWQADNKNGLLLCLPQVCDPQLWLWKINHPPCHHVLCSFCFSPTIVFFQWQKYRVIWYLLILLSAFHLNHVFFFFCRAPNPDTVLIMQTPLGVISTKSLLQTKKKTGSRLISSNRRKQDVTPIDNTEHEPFSAARCRIFQRTNHTKKVDWRKLLFMLVNVCKIVLKHHYRVFIFIC